MERSSSMTARHLSHFSEVSLCCVICQRCSSKSDVKSAIVPDQVSLSCCGFPGQFGVYLLHMTRLFLAGGGAACLYSPPRQKRPRRANLEEELYPQLVKTISHFYTWRCVRVLVWLRGLELLIVAAFQHGVCVCVCIFVFSCG